MQVSDLFGGLDLCSLEAVVAKDGTEFIIEVNDCAMGLLGETQEEDKKMIAEMVLKEMEVRMIHKKTDRFVDWLILQIKCKVPGKMEVAEDGLEMSAVDREMVDSGIGRNICRTDSHGEKFYRVFFNIAKLSPSSS